MRETFAGSDPGILILAPKGKCLGEMTLSKDEGRLRYTREVLSLSPLPAFYRFVVQGLTLDSGPPAEINSLFLRARLDVGEM